jgi:hypothetical protein
VQEVWSRQPGEISDPAACLVRFLKWTRQECKIWARGRHKPDAVIFACDQVVELLDLLEEVRMLTAQERLLRQLVAACRSLAVKELGAYWRQHFSFKLCKLGDENTAFYHASASARLCRNKIQVLHDGGVPVYTHAAKERILHSFYAGLLGTASHADTPPRLLDLLPAVSGLSTLEAPFSPSEVKEALWQMRMTSSPGLDGFGPAFYRKFWPVVGSAVMAFLNAFHQGTADFGRINQAHVALLPKKADVTTADGFRPVSLQNCVPKLAAKILTTRLQGVITSLISDLQTGFVKGRSITDNFLFASELLQCCRKKGAPTIALKLDFRKAFDSVDWGALDAILTARGFGAQWRAWMSTILATQGARRCSSTMCRGHGSPAAVGSGKGTR